MSREGALVVMIGVAVMLIGLGVWAWLRRMRRDVQPLLAPGEIPDGATTTGEYDVLYVATTAHDQPLERIAAPGLAFRSRATVTVTDRGIALDLTGSPRAFLATDRIVEVGQSTVAIDRVVEKDGLTRLVWMTDAGTTVDSYLRPQNVSAHALADAIGTHTTPTGSDA